MEQQRWEQEATSIRLRLTRVEEDVATLHGRLPCGPRLSAAIRDTLAAERSETSDDRNVLLQQLGKDRARWQTDIAELQMHLAALEKRSEEAMGPQLRLAEEQLRRTSAQACDRIDEAASREVGRAVEAVKSLLGREREQPLFQKQTGHLHLCDTGGSTPSVSTAATAEVGETPGQAELRLAGRMDELEVLLRERCGTVEKRLRLLDEAMLSAGQGQPNAEGERHLTAAEARLAMREESDWWRREVVRLEAETARDSARLDHLESRFEETACRGEVQRLRGATEVAAPADPKVDPSAVGLLSERVAQLDGELGALRALCREAASRAPVAGEALQREVSELCMMCRAARVDSQNALGAWRQEAEELRRLYAQVQRDGQALRHEVETVSAVHCSLPPLQQRVEELAAQLPKAPETCSATSAAIASAGLEKLRRAVDTERHEREEAQRLLSDGIEEKLQRIVLKVNQTCAGLLQGLGVPQASTTGSAVVPDAKPTAGDLPDVLAAAAAGYTTARSRVRVRALPCSPAASSANAGGGQAAAFEEPQATFRACSAPPRELGYAQLQVCVQPAAPPAPAPPLEEAITPRQRQLQRATSLQQLSSASQRTSASPTRHLQLGPSMGAPGARLREATKRQVAVPVDVVLGGQTERASASSAPASALVPAQDRDRLLRENRELRERNALLLEENAVMRYAKSSPREAVAQQQQPWPGASASATGPAAAAFPGPAAAPALVPPGAEEASASALVAAAAAAGPPEGPDVVAMATGLGQRGEHQGDQQINSIVKVFDAVHERLARRRSEMAATQAQRQAPLPQPPA